MVVLRKRVCYTCIKQHRILPHIPEVQTEAVYDLISLSKTHGRCKKGKFPK